MDLQGILEGFNSFPFDIVTSFVVLLLLSAVMVSTSRLTRELFEQSQELKRARLEQSIEIDRLRTTLMITEDEFDKGGSGRMRKLVSELNSRSREMLELTKRQILLQEKFEASRNAETSSEISHQNMEDETNITKSLQIQNTILSIGRIIANIDHTIAPAISGIKLSIHALGNMRSDENKKVIDELKGNVQLLEDLIKGYYDLGGQFAIPDGDYLNINLYSHISVAYELLSLLSEKRIDIRFEISPDMEVSAHTYRTILLVTSPVVLNAFEAVKDNGIVKISIERDTHKKTIAVRVFNSGGPIDDSIGNIYKHGVSTKEPGRGLGLAFAKSTLNEILSGDIRHENSKEGPTVIIDIREDSNAQ